MYKDFLTHIHAEGRTSEGRKTPSWQQKADTFVQESKLLFDIFAESPSVRKKQCERLGCPPMTEEDFKFLENMRGDRTFYCSSFSCKQWERTLKRREQEAKGMARMRERSIAEAEVMNTMISHEDIEEDESVGIAGSSLAETDTDFNPIVADECAEPPEKKRRRYVPSVRSSEEELPEKYCHVRDGLMNVRDEFFVASEVLVCVGHLSLNQACFAIVTVANILFGRSWKMHNEDPSVIDDDTLPHMRNIRTMFKRMEALVLSRLAHLIADSESTTVTYHEDGSRKQGTGSFMVSGVTIDGVYRALPTLNIASESKANLAELRVTLLNLLTAVSGIESRVLYEKMDFVMTDATSHNIGVPALVGARLETDHQPDQLLCQVHPVMCFNRELSSLWKDVELTIGRDKIYANFLHVPGHSYPSVTDQFLDVITRLISPDFDHKPWNKSKAFDQFIGQDKKVYAKSLRTERFERLTYAAATVVYSFEDVKNFLATMEYTNELAIISRQFLKLDFFKVMSSVGALLGLHLVQPFLALTFAKRTNHDVITDAFRRLHTALLSVAPQEFLRVDGPALPFVSDEVFAARKYPEEICVSILEMAETHREDVVRLIGLLLPRLAHAFERQRGQVCGFGATNPEECQLASYDQNKLSGAPVHNMAAECHVGSINAELKLRGSAHLPTASRSVVCGKNSDLLSECEPAKFREFGPLVKPDGPVDKVLKEWSEKQEEIEGESLASKQDSNKAVDVRRHKDLTFLQSHGGPFVSVADLDSYISDLSISEKDKEQRLMLISHSVHLFIVPQTPHTYINFLLEHSLWVLFLQI